MYELAVKSYTKAFEAKPSEEQKQFRQKVSQALSNLLLIDIEIAESCINTTMTRQTNLRMLIEQQKRIQDMTFEEQLPNEAEPNQTDFLTDKMS